MLQRRCELYEHVGPLPEQGRSQSFHLVGAEKHRAHCGQQHGQMASPHSKAWTQPRFVWLTSSMHSLGRSSTSVSFWRFLLCENPMRSWMWETSFQNLPKNVFIQWIHSCIHGSERLKKTAFLMNFAAKNLLLTCDGKHAHLPWGKTISPHSGAPLLVVEHKCKVLVRLEAVAVPKVIEEQVHHPFQGISVNSKLVSSRTEVVQVGSEGEKKEVQWSEFGVYRSPGDQPFENQLLTLAFTEINLCNRASDSFLVHHMIQSQSFATKLNRSCCDSCCS